MMNNHSSTRFCIIKISAQIGPWPQLRGLYLLILRPHRMLRSSIWMQNQSHETVTLTSRWVTLLSSFQNSSALIGLPKVNLHLGSSQKGSKQTSEDLILSRIKCTEMLQLKLAFTFAWILSSSPKSAQILFRIKRMIICAEFPAIGKLFFTGYVVCNWNKKSIIVLCSEGLFKFSCA